MECTMRNIARGLLITLALMAWGLDASVAEDVPPTSLQAAAAILKGQGKPSLKKPSAALMAAMEHLKTMPKIHTRAFAERVDHPEERTQMLADLEGLEKLLEGVACLTPALESASNEEFVSSLNLLLNLRNRVLKPGSYGNLVAAMGITQYSIRLTADRLLRSPGMASSLEAVVEHYAPEAVPSWHQLDTALAKETRGAMHLTLQANISLRGGLLRMLHLPCDVPVNMRDAEEVGPHAAAVRALTESNRAMLMAVPHNLDEVHPVGLVFQLAITQSLIDGCLFWSAFLQKHKRAPETLDQLKDILSKEDAPTIINSLTEKNFGSRDAFGYLLMGRGFVRQAQMFLIRGPRPFMNDRIPKGQ